MKRRKLGIFWRAYIIGCESLIETSYNHVTIAWSKHRYFETCQEDRSKTSSMFAQGLSLVDSRLNIQRKVNGI